MTSIALYVRDAEKNIRIGKEKKYTEFIETVLVWNILYLNNKYYFYSKFQSTTTAINGLETKAIYIVILKLAINRIEHGERR